MADGAASSHIAVLTREREGFVEASRSQAASIANLEKQVAALKEDLQTAHEQLQVQGLISESRARQLEEQQVAAEVTETKLTRMRSAVRLLWGLLQEMQMRVREHENSVKAGSELLESLSELLAETAPNDGTGTAGSPSERARR